jgi:apolipoprotein N-acyltransferase
VAIAGIALRRPRVELLWLAALPFLAFLPAMPDARPGKERALLVQPNISETEQWTGDSVIRQEDALADATLRGVLMAGERKPEIVVWPEDPAPLYYYQDARFHDEVKRLALATHAYMLVGTVARAPDGSPLNSATLVSPAGKEVSRYDKVNLVPFGEFVPWPLGKIANTISTEAGDFTPGKRVVTSPMDSHYIGTFICYESVFPNFVRQFVRDGADALFTISNDGWFGKSAARDQHLSIVRMRAAENRRWILRAANDGVTATIDPAGRVMGHLPYYEAATSYTAFNFVAQQTLYTRFGDWFPGLCALIAAAGLIGPPAAARMRESRRSAKS